MGGRAPLAVGESSRQRDAGDKKSPGFRLIHDCEPRQRAEKAGDERERRRRRRTRRREKEDGMEAVSLWGWGEGGGVQRQLQMRRWRNGEGERQQDGWRRRNQTSRGWSISLVQVHGPGPGPWSRSLTNERWRHKELPQERRTETQWRKGRRPGPAGEPSRRRRSQLHQVEPPPHQLRPGTSR